MRTTTPPLRGKAVARAGGFTASAGVVVVVVLTLISVVDYSVAEWRGLDPGWTPRWVLVGTSGGLVLVAVGLVLLIIGLVTMFVHARRGGAPKPLIVTVAIGLVVAAAVVNLVLVGWLMVEYVAGQGVGHLMSFLMLVFDGTPLLVVTMLPVAGMLYVAMRPAPTPVSRWSLLAGAVAFFALNLVWNWIILTTDSSTAALGFLISVPVLAGVAGLTAIPIAVSVNRAKRQGRLS